MNSSLTANNTLAAILWPEGAKTRWLRAALLAIAGTLLLWISAKIKVDLGAVPVTMQTFVILGLGAAYGWRLGIATLLLYLAQGAAGFPVFAGTPEKGIGLAYMMGPTGGYLAGFVLAVALIGYLAGRGFDRNPVTMFLAMLAATAVIYVPGLAWLSAFIGYESAIKFGLLPFIWGDLIKAALAAAMFPAIWVMLKRR
jgi:biotin transport system substrate-specific component